MKTRFLNPTLIVLAICSSSLANAQSAYFSASGGSSILLNPDKTAGQLQFESNSSIIHVRYTTPQTSGKPRVGYDLSGKPAGGKGTLWSDGAYGGNIAFHVTVLRPGLFDPTDDNLPRWKFDEVGITAGVTRSTSKLFDSAAPVGSQFADKTLNGWDVSLNYWGQFADGFYLGGRVGAAKDSNAGDLRAKSYVTGAPAIATSAFAAADYDEAVIYPIRIDALYQVLIDPGKVVLADGTELKRALGFAAFASKNRVGYNKWVPGVGIFISAPGAPTSIVGGIVSEWKDGKSTVSLVVGYSF